MFARTAGSLIRPTQKPVNPPLPHLDLTPGASGGKGAGVSYPKVLCSFGWIGWSVHEPEQLGRARCGWFRHTQSEGNFSSYVGVGKWETRIILLMITNVWRNLQFVSILPIPLSWKTCKKSCLFIPFLVHIVFLNHGPPWASQSSSRIGMSL